MKNEVKFESVSKARVYSSSPVELPHSTYVKIRIDTEEEMDANEVTKVANAMVRQTAAIMAGIEV